jgi:hypothetical protein
MTNACNADPPRGCSAWFRRGARAAAIGAALALAFAGAAPAADVPEELEVKAAFILNFVRLVNWSADRLDKESGELVICALSGSELFIPLRDAAAGRCVAGRPVVVRAERTPDPLRCHAFVLDAAQYGATSARLGVAATRDAPVLTVGNGPGFLDMGGMFELVVRGRKVEFDVSLPAVQRSGLEVSARLLLLARNLRGGAGAAR